VDTRASLHCGWLDRGAWTACGLPKVIVTEQWSLDICPGWASRQPGVEEGALAYDAYRNGELSTFFPGEENPVLEAVAVARRSFNAYEAYRIETAAKRRA